MNAFNILMQSRTWQFIVHIPCDITLLKLNKICRCFLFHVVLNVTKKWFMVMRYQSV